MPSMSTPLLSLAVLWLLFFLYSMIGWVIETTYCSVPEGHFINRGFLNGPYIPIYGTGAMIAVIILSGIPRYLGDISGYLGAFLLGGTLSCVVEYVTSWAMERLYHARWWDYSRRPLNLNGRIWIGGFAEFGGCCVGVLLVNPFIVEAIEALPEDMIFGASLVTAAVFVSDVVVTNVGTATLRENMDFLRLETSSRLHALRESLPSLHVPELHERPEIDLPILDRVEDTYPRPRMESATQAAQETLSTLGEVAPHPRQESTVQNIYRMRAESPDSLSYLHLPSLPSLRDIPGLRELPAVRELAESFAARLNKQQRRLMRAFPTARPTNWEQNFNEYEETLREYAEYIRELEKWEGN